MTQFAPDLIRQLRNLINSARRIAVVCHMTPDGDALGSSLCLMHTLRAMGKHVTVVTPDAPPKTLMFLPGASEITVASYHCERAKYTFIHADLIFCLDFNDLKRIDRSAPLVMAASAPIVMIDHHLNPVMEPALMFSRPELSSTCALLYLILEASGIDRFIGSDAATCCCAGMMTDTGNFAYNANDPQLYRILSLLMERGVDKNKLYNRLFNTNTLRRIRIMGYCQYARTHMLPEHRCAIITLSLDEVRDFAYTKGDTEGLVNIPLSIPGVVYSIFLRQDEPDYVKISMRSKGNFSVKQLCEDYFSGGGHLNAAGGELRATLDEALSKVLEILPKADALLLNYNEESSPA